MVALTSLLLPLVEACMVEGRDDEGLRPAPDPLHDAVSRVLAHGRRSGAGLATALLVLAMSARDWSVC